MSISRENYLAEAVSITLRAAVPADEEFLFHLYCKIREPEFSYLNLPDQPEKQLLRIQHNAQQSGYRVQYPDSENLLVLHEGVPAGRIWIARLEQEIRLVDITLLAEFRSRGTGTFLVKEILIEARKDGVPVRSSVFRFNPGSLRFHQRLGFQVVAEDEIQFYMEWVPENMSAG
jgi:GNAT superfamily N-acetyltransferase